MFLLHRSGLFGVVLLFATSTVISQHEFDYSDIVSINASCAPKDSCANRIRRVPFANRSCECDRECHQYKDCCIDVRVAPIQNSINQNVDFECFGYELGWGVYVISKCPTGYDGDLEIQSKCEDGEGFSSPLAAVPATDIVFNVTYRNHYCAQCNNAQPENLRTWDIRVECKVVPNNTVVDAAYIEAHLSYVYVDDKVFWGFHYPEDSSNFYHCSVPSRLSESLGRHVRVCRRNIVSTCADNWSDEDMRRKCEAYTAAFYVSPNLYRNPHCALCNNRILARGLCNIPAGIEGKEKKSSVSFTVIMDVYKNRNSPKPNCRANEQWDPFLKQCQSLSCAIPGYRIRNGVCVPP